jgi:hypothetical protein
MSQHDSSQTQESKSTPKTEKKETGKNRRESGKQTGEQILVDQHVVASTLFLARTKKEEAKAQNPSERRAAAAGRTERAR